PGVGAAVRAVRTCVDNPLRADGDCSMAGLACRRVSRCTYSPDSVSGATRSQRALELAVLRVATRWIGICGHYPALGAYRCDTSFILARPAIGVRAAYPVSALGKFRLRAQLFRVETQPADSGLTGCAPNRSFRPMPLRGAA